MARTKQTASKSTGQSQPRKRRQRITLKVNPPGTKANKAKRPYRKKPGTEALREIRRMQKKTDLLIPKVRFSRVVRELARDVFMKDFRFRPDAIVALQEAAEAHIVTRFACATELACHAKRVTVMPSDFAVLDRVLAILSGGAGTKPPKPKTT